MGSGSKQVFCHAVILSAAAMGLLSGCATTYQQGPEYGQVPGAGNVDRFGATGESLVSSIRPIESAPDIQTRRTIELPSGYVRTNASWQTTKRRSGHVFSFVPRKITCRQAWDIATTVGTEAGIDPGILFGIMRVESTLAVNAMSCVGAVGLMQVMPGPADRLGCGDRLDPLDNARCGVQILSRFLKRYKNDLILGLSAYNAGFGMPNTAKKKNKIPANFSYPENVLRVRAKFLRWGCASWD